MAWEVSWSGPRVRTWEWRRLASRVQRAAFVWWTGEDDTTAGDQMGMVESKYEVSVCSRQQGCVSSHRWQSWMMNHRMARCRDLLCSDGAGPLKPLKTLRFWHLGGVRPREYVWWVCFCQQYTPQETFSRFIVCEIPSIDQQYYDKDHQNNMALGNTVRFQIVGFGTLLKHHKI